MTMPLQDDFWGLTEKERQTLRLIVRGHDAKSIAGNLGLSVHTINERLRDARRKMAVSSSREAARLLLDKEGDHAAPYSLGDEGMGDDAAPDNGNDEGTPIGGVGRVKRPRVITGVLLMTLLLALLALAPLAQVDTATPSTTPTPPTDAAVDASHAEEIQIARQWLALVDQGRWEESYKETGKAFQELNTLQLWIKTSELLRVPMGRLISRDFVSEQYVPAPPYGYEMLKFHSSYANRAKVMETVTLNLDDHGHWRVVGVTVE